MNYPVINDCPVCHHELHVTKLECSHCHTTIENRFHLSKWHSFSDEQMHFIETFILSRGSIKEVEKNLVFLIQLFEESWMILFGL